MTEQNQPTIRRIDDKRNPPRDEYQRYVDVWFTNGVKVRHVVDNHDQYFTQVFHPDDHDTVWDDILIEQDFEVSELDEYLVVWLDVTTNELQRESSEDWTTKMITMEDRASVTNVQYE